jgi:ABC-type lipoprotein release transport system permease subunit
MTQALVVIGGLFLLVYVPLGVLAWRRPLLARFAFREGTRRRGQFALLAVGLLVGSASITASLVGADSASQTVSYASNHRLGAVDLTVITAGGRSFPADVASRLGSDPDLRPYVDGVQAGVEIPAAVIDLDQRLGKPGVLLVGFDPASQRRFGAYALSGGRRTYGDELATGDALLSGALATALDAKAGDRLRVSTGSSGGVDMRVFAIATGIGPGAYGSALALYVPLATAQLVTGDTGINVVRIAATGGAPGDDRAARLAAPALRSAIARLPADPPLTVNELRVDVVHQSENGTAFVLAVTLGFSGLTIMAAIALIVNLVMALAEERRSRLAVLRALGLTRAGLIALAILEGAIYSLAAAVAGVAIGVPAGFYLAAQYWNALLIDPGVDIAYRAFPMQLAVRPGTLALGFAAGSLLTLGTVAATAYRTSRLAIAAAIRDLPEPDSAPHHNWWRTGLLILLAALGAGLLVPGDLRTRLVGGVILIATVAGLARGRLPDRARATIGGLLVSAWPAVMVATNPNLTSDLSMLVTVILIGVAVPAVGLSIAAAANLKLIDAGLGLAGNRLGLLQATLRPPLAYLSRRPVRTGLATSAFALVLVLVTMIAVAVASAPADFERDSAGFDVVVAAAGPEPVVLPPEVAQQLTAQTTLAVRLYQGPIDGPGFVGHSSSTAATFYVLPDQPPDSAPVYVNVTEKRYHSNGEVWQAVRSAPRVVVFPSFSGVAAGNEVTVAGRNGPVRLHVAGTQAGTVLNGFIVAPVTLAELDTTPGGSTLLLKAKPGTDARALAKQVERSLFPQGVQATSIRDILEQDAASGLAYTTEYDVLLPWACWSASWRWPCSASAQPSNAGA